MEISLIVAMTKNRVIGKDNDMPWHLPADLTWFKRNTLNKPVIMGRKTFLSIGRPLPNRTNVILSRSAFEHEGTLSANSLEQALEKVGTVPEAMIIGGGELFKQTLPIADKLYLTEIQTELEGDTFFPEIDLSQWTLIEESEHKADEKNAYDCHYKIYQRIK